MEEEIIQLMDLYEKLFISRAYAITGSSEDAQDVVQDVFIKYIKLRKKGTLVDNPKSWFYTAIRNQSIDLIRKRTRKLKLENETNDHELIKERFSSKSQDGLTELINLERVASTKIALGILNERELHIAQLRFTEDKSYKEIADVMKLTSSNIGFILHKIIKKLRQAVEQEGALSNDSM
ncbi:MAG: sigma-70 family RNA polymerase sigma factor [Lentisphaeria bacterium]|nr:sigma-70 family RNA polymerase sigma factor [Lentisphaeria bacterium]